MKEIDQVTDVLSLLRKKVVELEPENNRSEEIEKTLLAANQQLVAINEQLKEYEQQLKNQQERLVRTQRIAHVGSWDWDVATDIVTWSDELFEIFRLDPENGAPSYAEHPKIYTAESMESLDAAVRHTLETGKPYEIDLEILRGDGTTALCTVRGYAESDDNGRVIHLYGSFQDITERKNSEEQLRKSEERLRLTIDNSPFPIAVVDEKDQNILFWSKSAVELFGHDPKTAAEWYELAYPDPEYRRDVVERWKPLLEVAQASGKAVNTGEYEIHCKDGSVKNCELHAQFIPGSLIITLNNITDRKLSEKQLRDRNQQLRVNEQQLKAANQQLQASEQQLKASNQQLRANEQQLKAANQQLRANEQQLKAANQQLQASEQQLKSTNQELSASGQQLLAANQQLRASEQQLKASNQELFEAKKQSEENEALLKAAMENSQAGIVIADVPSGALTYVNRAALSILNNKYEEIVENVDVAQYVETWQMLHLDGTPFQADEVPLARAVVYGERNSEEFIVRRDDGEDRCIWVNAAPVLNDEGERIAAIVVFLDVTEKNNAEISLRKLNEELEKVQEIARIGSWHLDTATNEVVWSKELYKMYGFAPDSPVPSYTEHMKLFTPESWDLLSAAVAKTTEKGIPYDLELRTVRKDNSNGWIWARGEALYDENNKMVGIWGTAQDIVERKNLEIELQSAEEKAEESEKQLTHIADNFADGMIYQVAMLDDNTRRFNYVSDAVSRLYGCTPAQAKENPDLIYGKIHPDDVDGLIRAEKEALKQMSTFRMECRTIDPEGNIRWAYYVSQPRMINGVVCWDGIEVDITRQKEIENELKIAKDKAEESDRLKSAFLANMSHEIRTPMNGILGFTDLLKEPKLTGDEKDEYICIIESSGNRLLNTVNDIIDISKIEAGQMKISVSDVNISELLEQLHTFFVVEAQKNGLKLLLDTDSSTNEVNLLSDKEKIFSVLTNLIKNAIKYTQNGTIEFGCTLNGKSLQFFVKDTGRGISPKRLDSIFGRFIRGSVDEDAFTEGSGLGLSISKAYVEMLGGEIWLESEEGVGSQFYFTIPYENVDGTTSDQSKPVAEEKLKIKINDLKILIAEDDEAADALLSILIKDISKEVLHAKNGARAVELCRSNSDIDLILMDIFMPELNGYEATRKIREFNRDVVIIAQTAFALAGDREKALEAGCNAYISKPIIKKDLMSLIQQHVVK